ncbi:MAG: sulfatase-like hydrolase/transferase [Verrucomicrobia bacterium]|nr:sulfatase-like hydrolase/transferase [Verrucomicrobiota bacterium]
MKRFVLFCCWLGVAGGRALAAEAGHPNFLLILVDDQSPWDFGFYNPASELRSPNLDRLAAEGMVFEGAYHMGSFLGAVCTPSRHMIMTGRTLWHLPIGPTAAKNCPAGIENQSLPAVFNRAGYQTMRTSKTGNSYEAANRLFTVRRDADKRGGTDETGSAWHAEQVLQYLEEREKSGEKRPFLIEFGFSHPHDTRDGKPEYLAHYGAVNHADPDSLPSINPAQPKLPPNWLPEKPFPDGHPGLRDETTVSGVWHRRDEATIRNELGRQFACAENIDTQVGRVIARLEAMGELANTYIVYTADHGIAIGRHAFQGKQNLYEHTWRVPFIVKGPGIQAGARVQGNIYLLDILATFCDLAGIPAPETNEGLSFRKVLQGGEPMVRDVVYGVYNGGTKPGMRSLRMGDWKLIEYDVLDGTVRRSQLFNLKENPNEWVSAHHRPEVRRATGIDPAEPQRDLSEDPVYEGKLREMRDRLLVEMRHWEDPYRLWNQPDDGMTPPPEITPKPKKRPREKAGRGQRPGSE